MKIKVLQLVEDLNIGGAEKVIADISLGLDKQKFDVLVWCVSSGGAIAEELHEKGISLRILRISSYFNPLNILKLSRRFRKENPDILHTHGYFASVIGRIAAVFAGIPVIFTHVHSMYWDYKKRNIWIEKFLSRFTTALICCSEAVREFVTDHEKIDPSKTIVIYNGVNEKRFFQIQSVLAARQALGIELGVPVVGTVSSLNAHKGHTFLLEAAAKVLEVFPEAQFLLVGDGDMKEELEIKAQKLNLLSSLKFLGTRKDIPEILAAIDIFVLPSSSREGLGISLLEAMAAEKPVVASDIGGIPEVVFDGETGILVPPKNAVDLAGAIIELLKNPAKAALMGQQGRQRVKEKFTTQQMLEDIMDLYTSFLQKKT